MVNQEGSLSLECNAFKFNFPPLSRPVRWSAADLLNFNERQHWIPWAKETPETRRLIWMETRRLVWMETKRLAGMETRRLVWMEMSLSADCPILKHNLSQDFWMRKRNSLVLLKKNGGQRTTCSHSVWNIWGGKPKEERDKEEKKLNREKRDKCKKNG